MPFRISLFLSSNTRLIAALATSAIVSACSSDSSAPPVDPGPTPAAWRWMAPVAEGTTLTDIWGATADNLFASGASGIVLRYDGSVWRKTTTPTTQQLNALWGTSGNNVVAVGGVIDGGVILHFNGSTWVQTADTDNPLLDVWGSGASDVFAVGWKRTIMHYDGASWSPMAVPAGDQALTSVWGSGPGDVYASGLGKSLLHYDGNSWSEVVTPATFALYSVWGAGPNDVFAVGGNGAAVYFDGVDWSPIDIGESVFFSTVWGTSASEVFAMGQSGVAYRWDGATWWPYPRASTKKLNRVFGVDGRVFAVGDVGTVLELAGNEWVHAPGCLTVDLRDVWVSTRGDVVAVGDLGTIIRMQNGVWESMQSGTTQNLRGVNGVAWNDMIAVGENGIVLRYDGTSWTSSVEGPGFHLADVWMFSSTDAFAVGDAGVVLRLQGGVWMDYSANGVTESLLSVWGPTSDEVYVVGAQSRALKWNGLQWKLVTIDLANTHTFHGVFGTASNDVYVASELFGPASASEGGAPVPAGALHVGGSVFHWNGGTWLPVYQDPGHDILSVWAVNRESAFACGDAASVLVRTDSGWTRVFSLQNLPFYVRSVWGSSANNVFIVGDNGTVASYSR